MSSVSFVTRGGVGEDDQGVSLIDPFDVETGPTND